MKAAITVDLRQYDIETLAEFKRLVHEVIPSIREDYPMVAICGLVISDRQMKRLRLERFIKLGLTNDEAKRQVISRIDGWRVLVVPEGEQPRDEAHLHDSDQPWYGGR